MTDTVQAYIDGTMTAEEAAAALLIEAKDDVLSERRMTPSAVYENAEDIDPFKNTWGKVNLAWASKQMTDEAYQALSGAVDTQRGSTQ